ncbi:MAG: hypothetical protein KGO23_14480, partial [Nitrospirota bacterium]|nr:hypothetical protein [Nitrospirota bacterium]
CIEPVFCQLPSRRLVLILSPHYSRMLLLQSPIRCYDEPSAGGLAPRTLTVLQEYASGPHGFARRSRDAPS